MTGIRTGIVTGAVGRLVRCLLAVGLVAAALAGCGGGAGHGRVTVMVQWSGAEFQAFYRVVKDFEADTGIQVDVQVTRALTQQLDAAVDSGAPPDVAMLSSVGAIDHYARGGNLEPLGGAAAAAARSSVQPLRGLAAVRGRIYAVPVKADVQSLFWYDPRTTEGPPSTTLPALQAMAGRSTSTWCLGLESGPTSGWPGADWIGDILLAQNGTAVFKQWLSGRVSWTDPRVKAAWTSWWDLVGGIAKQAATRPFGDAASGMTAHGGTRCAYAHGQLAAMGFAPGLTAGKDYDFVPSSPQHRLLVSADFAGLFRASPEAARFVSYLAGHHAQLTWVNTPGGYAISPTGTVRPAAYTNPVQRRIAALLQPDAGNTLCFNPSDAMEPDVSAAFYRAVMKYATGTAGLSGLLLGLDGIQHPPDHDTPVPPDRLCTA
jgi:alpha-glucoside transport system substrate-binding protein